MKKIEARGVGRPQTEQSVKAESSLKEKGVARIGIGGRIGEQAARARLYSIGKKLGMRVKTKRVSRGAVKYIEANVEVAK